MRIYTEVNFQWDDKQNNYIETSSKSFDYHGEMALCAWEEWETRWYDTAGNVYKIRVRVNDYIGSNPAKKRSISKSTDGGTTWEDGWKVAKKNVKKSEALRWFKREVELFGDGKQAHANAATAKKAFIDTYGHEPSDNPTENTSFMEGTTDADFQDGKYIGDTPSWLTKTVKQKMLEEDEPTTVIVPGEVDPVTPFDVDDLYGLTDEDEITRRKNLVDSLKKEVDKWEAILDVGTHDEWQAAIETAGQELKYKVEDLEETYLDIEEEYTDATADMFEDINKITGAEGTYTTGVSDAKEQYTKDITEATRIEEEGLEGTVGTRKEEFATIQEELRTDIRAAEAKGGATGFVGAGVGQTARNVLARQFAKEALKTETGFIETREDVRDAEDRAATEALDIKVKKLRDLKTLKDTGVSGYEDIRDDAVEAKEDLWETASGEYDKQLARYRGIEVEGTDTFAGGTIKIESEKAISELQGIQASMEALIQGYRDDPTREDTDLYADYSPFQYKGFLQHREEEFGWTGDIFGFESARNIFEQETRYTEYTPDVAEWTYDPTFVPGLLSGQVSGGGIVQEDEDEDFDIPT